MNPQVNYLKLTLAIAGGMLLYHLSWAALIAFLTSIATGVLSRAFGG